MNADRAFFTDDQVKHYTLWKCSEGCNSLCFPLDNLFVHYGDSIYRQVIRIPIGTTCAPLIADLFLHCYERNFMLNLDKNYQADVITEFNNTSRYADDISNLDTPFFDNLSYSINPK